MPLLPFGAVFLQSRTWRMWKNGHLRCFFYVKRRKPEQMLCRSFLSSFLWFYFVPWTASATALVKVLKRSDVIVIIVIDLDVEIVQILRDIPVILQIEIHPYMRAPFGYRERIF